MRNRQTIKLILCGAVIALLVVATHYRNEVWQSSLGLWRDNSLKTPERVRPRNNVAVELIQLGRYEEAIVEFKEALRLDPKSADALHNLGTVYTAQGKLDEALYYLFEAIRASERSGMTMTGASAHNNVGCLLVKKHAYHEAIVHFEEAVKLMPDFPQAKENLRTLKEALSERPGKE